MWLDEWPRCRNSPDRHDGLIDEVFQVIQRIKVHLQFIQEKQTLCRQLLSNRGTQWAVFVFRTLPFHLRIFHKHPRFVSYDHVLQNVWLCCQSHQQLLQFCQKFCFVKGEWILLASVLCTLSTCPFFAIITKTFILGKFSSYAINLSLFRRSPFNVSCAQFTKFSHLWRNLQCICDIFEDSLSIKILCRF